MTEDNLNPITELVKEWIKTSDDRISNKIQNLVGNVLDRCSSNCYEILENYKGGQTAYISTSPQKRLLIGSLGLKIAIGALL